MPASSLAILTSPILIGAIPPAQIDELATHTPQEVAAPVELLPTNWSLTMQDGTEQVGESGAQDPQDAGEDDDSEVIVVEGQIGPPEGDPMVELNETSYRITQAVDDALVEPLAYGYRDGLPGPLRDGLGNVVRNLSEPANFLNFLLQLKFGDAAETLGRFAINSTIGLGGLIDVAGSDEIGLPYRRNGFANTMGYYGIGPGSYLYVPVAGATTVRDIIGNSLDQLVLPVAVGRPFNTPEYGVPVFIVSNLESRLEVDEELSRIEDTIDPYAARRDTYLARREREIAELRGDPVPPKPRILQEIDGDIEPGDPLLEEQEAAEEESEGIEPSDAPRISYEDTLELPEVRRLSVAITQTRERSTLFERTR